eukprot:gene5904-5802_t
MLAVSLVASINEVFQIALSLRELFESPVFTDLCQTISCSVSLSNSILLLHIAVHTTPYALSESQKRLWVLEQLIESRSSPYVVYADIVVPESVPTSDICLALHTLMLRHDLLRSCFPDVDGVPVRQHLPASTPMLLHFLDLSGLSHQSATAALRDLAPLYASRVHIAYTMPWYAVLASGPGVTIVHLGIHHIVTDRLSMELLASEMTHICAARANGAREPVLAPLAVTYQDYVSWQHQLLSSPAANEARCYWEQTLADLPAMALPIDNNRPAVQTFEGSTASVHLPGHVLRHLHLFAASQEATPFAVLLAALAVALGKACSQSSLAFGVPVGGRTSSLLSGLVGYFINTVIMRVGFAPDTSVASLVADLHDVVISSLDHQMVPFDSLVQSHAGDHDLSKAPLVQVTYDHVSKSAGQGAALSGWGVLSRAVESAKFDLSFTTTDLSGSFVLEVEYNIALFQRSTAMRLLNSFAASVQRRVSV